MNNWVEQLGCSHAVYSLYVRPLTEAEKTFTGHCDPSQADPPITADCSRLLQTRKPRPVRQRGGGGMIAKGERE